MPTKEGTQSELFALAVFQVPWEIALQTGADEIAHHHIYNRKRTSRPFTDRSHHSES